MKKLSLTITVFLIIVLGLLARTYKLDLDIPSLYADEVGGGYGSYVYFQKPAVSLFDFLYKNFYIKSVNFTWLLGLTPLSVRLPSAIYGTILLFFLYLFAKKIYFKEIKKDFLPLAALVAFSFAPWGIHLSRIGHPFVLLFLIMMSLHWILYLGAKSPKEYLVSAIPLFLAAWCYPSGIILGPLFVLLLVAKRRKDFLAQDIKIVFILIIMAIGIVVFMLPKSGIRGFDLAIWRDVNVTANENLDRGLARLSSPSIFSFNRNPDLTARLFYNYPLSVVRVFIRNYLSFFSPDFLFLKGDPVLRHSSGRFGELYLLFLPFLIYGTFLMVTRGEPKTKEMFLFWIVVAPIPGAITKDGAGYLLRVTAMLPLLTYLSALGFVGSLEFFTHKTKLVYFFLISFLFIFSVYNFLFNYFHVYPLYSAKSFEYGFRQLADFQKENNNQSMLVIWDGYYPHFHFRFWQKTDYREYLNNHISDIFVNESKFTRTFYNLYFSLPRNEDDLISFLNQNPVNYLILPADLSGKFSHYKLFAEKPTKVIYYPDQTPAFYLYQVKRQQD